MENADEKIDFASAPSALARKFQNESEGITEIVRINTSFRGDVVSDKMNIPIRGYYVDSNFFSVFDFDMIQGNPLEALTKPNSIVLSESVAKKFVISGDLLGKIIEVEGIGNFEVTGVIKDQKRTHLWFEVLVSFSTLPSEIRGEESNPIQWTSYTDQYIYLLVNDPANRAKLQESLNRIAGEVSKLSKDTKVVFKLQKLGDITPGPDLENSIGPDTDYTLIVIFVTICLLILLPACFNYANISHRPGAETVERNRFEEDTGWGESSDLLSVYYRDRSHHGYFAGGRRHRLLGNPTRFRRNDAWLVAGPEPELGNGGYVFPFCYCHRFSDWRLPRAALCWS